MESHNALTGLIIENSNFVKNNSYKRVRWNVVVKFD